MTIVSKNIGHGKEWYRAIERDFNDFIFSHFDHDIEFVRALKRRNKSWNDKKFSRIKLGIQEPKIREVDDMAKVTKTPLAEVAQFFLAE